MLPKSLPNDSYEDKWGDNQMYPLSLDLGALDVTFLQLDGLETQASQSPAVTQTQPRTPTQHYESPTFTLYWCHLHCVWPLASPSWSL